MVARCDAGSGARCRKQSNPSHTAMEPMKKPSVYVLLGGLVAGTFDITYACTYWFLKRGGPAARVPPVAPAGPARPGRELPRRMAHRHPRSGTSLLHRHHDGGDVLPVRATLVGVVAAAAALRPAR